MDLGNVSSGKFTETPQVLQMKSIMFENFHMPHWLFDLLKLNKL